MVPSCARRVAAPLHLQQLRHCQWVDIGRQRLAFAFCLEMPAQHSVQVAVTEQLRQQIVNHEHMQRQASIRGTGRGVDYPARCSSHCMQLTQPPGQAVQALVQ